ncbi:uncharacterized protein G2W53_011233 [Senna tora]|uniref:Uncharacterized protein n=1 Tax=Senna tora TaxID=362788 RepID=A0A834X1T5_9FABA|nr:uncharacterized protein G2W53_011233 [Senna tora]
MKMETIQVGACQPRIYVKSILHLHYHPSKPCVLPGKFNPLSQTSFCLRAKTECSFQSLPILKSRQSFQVCLAGGSGMMENNNEDYPRKAFEKAMKNFKGQSIEDVLRQQIEEGRGSGVKPPTGGGGSGGGSSGSGDEGSARVSKETLQVVFATIGFIFLYICIISGEELTKLARDYIKYLYSGKQSVRLKRAMFKWGRIYRSLTEKVVDKYCLEKTILRRKYLESKSDE